MNREDYRMGWAKNLRYSEHFDVYHSAITPDGADPIETYVYTGGQFK